MSRIKDCRIKQTRFSSDEVNVAFQKTYSSLRRASNKPVVLITDRIITQNCCKQVKSIDEISNVKDYNYIVYFDADDLSHKNIRVIIENKCKFMSLLIYYPTAEYYERDPNVKEVLVQSHKEEHRKFNLADYQNIIQAIDITKTLSGCYVEIGVMYGDSSNVAVNYMEHSGLKRESFFLDTYEGFKYAEAGNSSDILWNNTHVVASSKDHMNMIQKLLGPEAHVIKNNIITDNLPVEIQDVVVCNLDVDMYDAVKSGLFKIAPKIVKHGIIICEDAGHTPALIGAYCALKEFLESDMGHNFIPVQLESGQTFLIKK